MSRLFDAIIQFLTDFWPLKIIHTHQRGVLFKFGIVQERQLDPGIYWVWSFVWSVEIINVVPDTENLVTQSVTTSDGKAVSFSVNMQYEITDAVAAYTKVENYAATMRSEAMIHLARYIREHSLAELVADQKRIEDSLEGRLTTKFKKWGIAINEVGITDMVIAKQIRLFGDYAK